MTDDLHARAARWLRDPGHDTINAGDVQLVERLDAALRAAEADRDHERERADAAERREKWYIDRAAKREAAVLSPSGATHRDDCFEWVASTGGCDCDE